MSSIGDAAFAMKIRKGQDLVTMPFLIDDTTKIDGRLEIGSMATVDYRAHGGNNIALHIVVEPAPSH